jgi:hypothetical protein
MPLLRSAVPPSTGTILTAITARRSAAFSSASVSSAPSRYFSAIRRRCRRSPRPGARGPRPPRRPARRAPVGDLGLVLELAGEVQRLLGQQVDHALEGVLAADRQLDRHRVGAQALLDLGDDAVERRADAVELVDEHQPRDVELVGLVPHRLGLRLDAADRAEHHDRAVENAQERSTSIVKSTWPGVSIRWISCLRHSNVVAAAVMVMPRSRSCSIQSIWVSPSWTSPTLWILPEWKRNRSDTVVLPASMWATTPMLRT